MKKWFRNLVPWGLLGLALFLPVQTTQAVTNTCCRDCVAQYSQCTAPCYATGTVPPGCVEACDDAFTICAAKCRTSTGVRCPVP